MGQGGRQRIIILAKHNWNVRSRNALIAGSALWSGLQTRPMSHAASVRFDGNWRRGLPELSRKLPAYAFAFGEWIASFQEGQLRHWWGCEPCRWIRDL